nr:MAG TPA: hypothetical protein [Caudoviricetes sp.]
MFAISEAHHSHIYKQSIFIILVLIIKLTIRTSPTSQPPTHLIY